MTDFTLHSTPARPMVLENDQAECATFAQECIRLLAICTEGKVLGEDRAKVRGIGESIYRMCSHPGMQVAYYLVQAAWAHGMTGGHGEDDFHAGDLAMAWDGIGVWRS